MEEEGRRGRGDANGKDGKMRSGRRGKGGCNGKEDI